MMFHIFLVISIVVVVSGQEESKHTRFLDRDVKALIEINSKILKENENFKNLIYTLADKNVELERRVNFIEQNIPVSDNQRNKHGFHSNVKVNLYKNWTKMNGQGYPSPAKMNYPMLMPRTMNGSNHTKDKRQFKRETSGEVAFFARVLDTLRNLGDNQEIPYKDVVVDTHNAVHGDSGIFTTPVAGYYAVFSTIMTYPEIEVEFSIVRNGISKWVCDGLSTATKEAFGTGSTSAIVHLDVGDKIWVIVHPGRHTGSGDMVYEEYSSLMGFRL